MFGETSNRRRHRRSRVPARCWIERDSMTLLGRVLDLGEGGLFLRAAIDLPPGTDVQVVLRPIRPHGGTIRALGTVAWAGSRTEGRESARGLGISFVRVDEGLTELVALLREP